MNVYRRYYVAYYRAWRKAHYHTVRYHRAYRIYAIRMTFLRAKNHRIIAYRYRVYASKTARKAYYYRRRNYRVAKRLLRRANLYVKYSM